MKLWILSHLWGHLNRYWHKITNAKPTAQLPTPVERPVAGMKGKGMGASTKKNGKVYKFNPCDVSDSLSLSSPPRRLKNKRIVKKSKENRRIQNRDHSNSGSQEVKNIQNIFNDLTSEISSICERKSEDSCKTVKQFLIALDPKLRLTTNRVVFFESKVRKHDEIESKLTVQMLTPTLQRKPLITPIERPSAMKKNLIKCPPIYEAIRQQSQISIKGSHEQKQ